MSILTQNYLSINEQDDVIKKMAVAARTTPLHKRLFYSHGEKMSCGIITIASFVFWRSGFRAYNLHRYNKNRLSTLGLTLISGVSGALCHESLVRKSLTEYYRSENMLTYGKRSAIVHQIGLFTALLNGLGFTFIFAQKMGINPVPDDLFKKGVRQVAFNYFITRLRPYAKNIAITCIGSTALMFVIGLNEFRESQNLLAKINRRTLSLKED